MQTRLINQFLQTEIFTNNRVIHYKRENSETD